jgi:hypothetical protein
MVLLHPIGYKALGLPAVFFWLFQLSPILFSRAGMRLLQLCLIQEAYHQLVLLTGHWQKYLSVLPGQAYR